MAFHTCITRTRRRLAALTVTLLATSTSLLAQARPAGWAIVTDGAGLHAGGGGVRMVATTRGFQVETGPAAILFDSTMTASGTFRLQATIHLFDPGARAEGFGVFFGGRGLGTAQARYSYALVRRDGRALLKVREGSATRTVRDWTASSAVPVWSGTVPGASVKYPLVLEATADRVRLIIGTTIVLDAPRSEVPSDGIVGLRTNHALNVHVESVTLAPRAGRR